MARFPLIVKWFFAIVLLAMVEGSVCADDDKTTSADFGGSLQYRRIFVPEGQPELWPTQNQRYIPVPKKEFHKLIDMANRDRSKTFFSSPEVKISSADYEAKLEIDLDTNSEKKSQTYRIAGKARLRVDVSSGTTNDKRRFLSLGSGGMVVENLLWSDDKNPILVGTDKHGQLIARITRSGELQFDFSARNRSEKSGELRFDLTLPRSTRSAICLSLDSTWTVSVPKGLLLDRAVSKNSQAVSENSQAVSENSQAASENSQAASANGSKSVRWTIAPTLNGELCLLLTKPKDPSTLSEIPDVIESRSYDFSSRGLKFQSELQLSTSSGPMLPSSLRLGLEKPLTLVSARFGGSPVKWSVESESHDRTIISFELPPTRSRSATLRLRAACEIIEGKEWKLPRILPENVFWRSGKIRLQIASPLSIGRLVPDGCVREKIENLSEDQDQSIRLTPFRPDATATVSLGWEKESPTLSLCTIADLSGVDISVKQTLLFGASDEDCFELSAVVNSGWIVDSVTPSRAGLVADWRVETEKKETEKKETEKKETVKGKRLVIRLAKALSKHRAPLLLTLSARRLESPLGKHLKIRDLSPVEFDEVRYETRLMSITTINPYSVVYRGEEFVDSCQIEELSAKEGILLPKTPLSKIFLDNARAAQMEIFLEEQKPVYAATVKTVLTLTEENLVESYRFRCVPEESHIDRLLIHLSGEETESLRQEKEKSTLHFLPKSMSQTFRTKTTDDPGPQAFMILSPKYFSVVKLKPEDLASVGMDSDGETWEVTLKSPQSEPFELYAIRSFNFEKSSSVFPLTISPSLAAMPEAVEHHASLQIVTPDDTKLLIQNQRLDPVPITTKPSLKIQPLRAMFHYETTDALASSSDPALRVTVEKSKRTSLLAWKCVVQTEYGSDGFVKATARYNLENQGETRFRLLLPDTLLPLKITNVLLDGKYVGWTPEYLEKEVASSSSTSSSVSSTSSRSQEGTIDSTSRLTGLSVDLPRTKRFPSVTIHYSYRIDTLGVSQCRSLLAPKPECEVVSVDWRLLLPPGYQAGDYVAVNDLSRDLSTSNDGENVDPKPASSEVDSVLSPRKLVCWRTRLFGALGRSASEFPFNPLSFDSWSRLFDDFESEAEAASLDRIENCPDRNLYQVRYSSFERTIPIRVVHRDSLEVFRWTMFLLTIGIIAWPRFTRRVRRLPVAVGAALGALLLPPLASAIASGIFMGVLVALLGIWLLENGVRRSGLQKPTPPDRTDGLLLNKSQQRMLNASGSTRTSPAIVTRPTGTDGEKDFEATVPPDESTGTSIKLGKSISDETIDPQSATEPKTLSGTEPKTQPATKPKTTPPKRPGGSTIIRRTTMFWGLIVALLATSCVEGAVFFDATTSPEPLNEKKPAANVSKDVSPTTKSSGPATDTRKSSVRWPILIPTDQGQSIAPHADPILYLPEPFFRELELLAGQQFEYRDLWLFKNVSLRAILERNDSDKTIRPRFLFLTFDISLVSQNAEIEIPLDKKEVRLEAKRATLDGMPVAPRWAEDGKSLLVPVAGRGTHQLELTLVPLPPSHNTRWNVKTQRDESGLQIYFPHFSQVQLELTHPADMPCPIIEGLLSSTNENRTTTQATFASEGQLSIWWSEGSALAGSSKTLPKFDELLLLDVTPSEVTLQASWSLAAKKPDSSSKIKNRSLNGSLAIDRNGEASLLRDVTLSVDPQLEQLEISNGFTLHPIPGSPNKQRLRWVKDSDPPKQVNAKFTLKNTSGVGQFHAPALHIDQGRTVRHWLAVRVDPQLHYNVDHPKTPTPIKPAPSVSKVTPEDFMAVWKEKFIVDQKSDDLNPDEEYLPKPDLPSFVITDRVESCHFRTKPKSVEATVVNQILRISFGETSTSIRFEADWSSGSHDQPEPCLRVPKNFKVHSASLIDDDSQQSLRWSCTKEGIVHIETGILLPKPRTIRIEGRLEGIDTSKPVALPIISLLGAEDIPVHIGIYRKPDALLALKWKPLPVRGEPPKDVASDWAEGQLIQWLKQKPIEKPVAEVRITSNRPTIRARQVVTIARSESSGSRTAEHEIGTENGQYDMIAAFELTPKKGVIDEIAIFVPHTVVGPFRTEPILPLVRSHENEKGRTLIFHPEEPIKEWYQFRIASPMVSGETRIPDVKLYEVDNLRRYVVLPADIGDGMQRKWQTRLLNREKDQAILGGLMPIEAGARLYRVVGRQWLAFASALDLTDERPVVSTANLQVRWQEDGSYLGSAVFDLKPSGNKSCRLIVPHGLTLLDTRIGGIPTSAIEITSKKKLKQPIFHAKAQDIPHDLYEIYFNSKTLPQRVELLYQSVPDRNDLCRGLSKILRKRFQTPFLDAEIQQTHWTVQGPDSYAIQGAFDTAEIDSILPATTDNGSGEGTLIAPLTPFLTEQASLGKPVQWTTKGLASEWETVWISQNFTSLSALIPAGLLLLLVGALAFVRPVQVNIRLLLHRHRPLFGILFGLFWWLFLTPSVFGWVIIVTFLVVTYRRRNAHPQSDSPVNPIG